MPSPGGVTDGEVTLCTRCPAVVSLWHYCVAKVHELFFHTWDTQQLYGTTWEANSYLCSRDVYLVAGKGFMDWAKPSSSNRLAIDFVQ